MESDMTEDKNPQFSHITIGSPVEVRTVPTDEEDVIIIGSGAAASDALSAEAELDDSHERPVVVEKNEGRKVHDDPKSKTTDQEGEDLSMGKMPFLQKVILAFCAVAFVIAIVLVVLYRVTNGL